MRAFHKVVMVLIAAASVALSTPVVADPAVKQQFLQQCAGAAFPSPAILSYTCKTLIQGYVAGHEVSVRVAAVYAKAPKVPRLFCIPSSVTDDQVLESVLGWVDRHPADATNMLKQSPDQTGALAVVTKAIMTVYSCQQVPM